MQHFPRIAMDYNSAFDIALLIILCITRTFPVWNLSVLFSNHDMAG